MSEALERSFNPSVIADPGAEIARRDVLGRSVPAPSMQLRYGKTERQTIDIYSPIQANGSLVLYFHGGYWLGGSAAQSAFMAGPFLAAGTTVAIAGYDLCPDVTLATIIGEARAARDRVIAQAAELGIDTARILLCGSSAGAHLCAMLLQDGPSAWPVPPAAALVTGIYDLAPVLNISVNATIGLVEADVEPLSPLRRTAALCCRQLLVAAGGDEPEAWRAMSSALAEKAERDGVPAEYFVCRDENHFSVTTALGSATHALTRKTLALLAR